MPHQLLNIVLNLNEIAKENQTGPLACHWCNNQDNIIKYGTYERYEFSGQGRIRIQRFLCKRDHCRRTFSILPHPFLRFTRFSLCLLIVLLQLLDQQVPIAQICRHLAIGRTRVYWAIKKGRHILDWIEKEAKTEPVWAPCPCADPPAHWSDFLRMFAMQFYPNRYGPPLTNRT
jgi:transposase-like protein